LAKLSPAWEDAPAPAVSHAWVNPPSLLRQAFKLVFSVGSVSMDFPAGLEGLTSSPSYKRAVEEKNLSKNRYFFKQYVGLGQTTFEIFHDNP
jgi:hypothetical protein